jgi:molybdopterin synthase catalytic subunit
LKGKNQVGLANLIERMKSHPDYPKVGMILSHNGVVRETSRDGRHVSGLTLTIDHEALEAILAVQRKRPGIVDVLVEIREGSLKVGDDVMFIVVAGDLRDHVIPVLEDTLNAIKKRVTHKEEHFVSQPE